MEIFLSTVIKILTEDIVAQISLDNANWASIGSLAFFIVIIVLIRCVILKLKKKKKIKKAAHDKNHETKFSLINIQICTYTSKTNDNDTNEEQTGANKNDK